MFDKYIYLLILFIMIGINAVIALKCGRSRDKKLWRSHMIVGAAVITMASYALELLSVSLPMAYVAYSMYYISLDVTLFFFYKFTVEYTGLKKKRNPKHLWIIIPLVIDTITLVINTFWHFIYELETVEIYGYMYYKPIVELSMLFHSVVTYAIVFAIFITLLYKVLISPKIYREKYGIIVFLTSLMIILNALYIVLRQATDKGILVLAVIGIWIYYITNNYTPERLIDSALRKMNDRYADALMIVDDDENCIYTNELAQNLLGMYKGDLDGKDLLHGWCEGNDFAKTSDFVKYFDFDRAERSSLKLKVYYNRMFDKRGRYEGGLFQVRDLTDELNHIEQDKYRATHDTLTGLFNKDRFISKCYGELKNNPDTDYYMICMDIANFKFVNDLFGPQVGDDVLKTVAQKIDNFVQDDVYGRLENDHFAILMPIEKFHEDEFCTLSEEMGKVLSDVRFPLTIYFGVYEVRDRAIPISIMCDRAHMAIETLKGKTDAVIAYYTEDIRKKRLSHRNIATGLDDAIANNEIKMFLQAQTNVNGESKGAEALVRWIREDGSVVFPGDFIPVLEETGSICKLDMAIWEIACKKLADWKERGYVDKYISVNISPKDFYYLDLYEHFKTLVEKYGVEPSKLRLEITETAIMMNTVGQLDTLAKLKNDGFIIEIDDFGSGYSSLNMLKDIIADVLKIDMGFLQESEHEERSRKILSTIVTLARQLGMNIVVEGVETIEQLTMIKEMGVNTYQGYYFSKPIPVSEYEEKYL